MRFTNETFIAHPVDAVFAAYRDKLPDIVRYVDNVKAVRVLERSDAGPVATLHNEWEPAAEIPSFASAFIKADRLAYDDYATWDATSHSCRFVIKTRDFKDAVDCSGTNTFVARDGGTVVRLEGNFSVSIDSLPGVPSFVAKRVVPQLEKFIISMIQPNLEAVNQGVGAYLDAQG